MFKHLIAALAAGLLCSIAAQAAPVVSLTGPANGVRYLPPAVVTLTASASDPADTIARVDFYSGTTLIGTAASAPYTLQWTDIPTGTYSVTARAVNSHNASKTSNAIRVIVNTPPTVSLRLPATGASIAGLANIDLAADVNDADGSIAKVQFYRGGTLIGTVTTPPYTLVWANAPPGTYRITARATDNLGGVITSDATTVMVANPITVAMTAPASTRYLPPATIELAATASDANGSITQVDFYAGTTLIGSAATAPYSVHWSNVPAGSHAITAKATDSQGLTRTSAALRLVVDTAPTVTLRAPLNQARYVAPAVIALAADVADSDGSIAKVQFFNGGTLLATVTQAPYTHDWQGVARGSYTIRAKATDNLGVVTTSAPVTVQVVDNAAPTVSMTAPVNGATYQTNAPIELAATATDGDGSIAKVEFFDGTTLLATVTQPPYTFRWTDATAGSHAITARATDNAGAQTTSAAVTVSVTAAANLPPTVSMIATPTNATAPATILLNAAASDTDGSVAKVDFFNGSTLLASVSQAPYTYNWMNVTAGSYTITAKATDDRGAVTLSDPVVVTMTATPAPAQVYYIDSDHLNTPRVITDANNRIVWQWDNSDPFGGNVPEEDPGNTGTRMEFNLRFPGQYFDKETGLHYNYFRTYDPNTGRYVESDPIGLGGGINTYAYVGANPLMYRDPTGTIAVADDVVVGAIVITAACAASSGCVQAIRDAANAAARVALAGAQMCSDGYDKVRNWFTQDKTPNKGEPNSTHVNPGSGQERKYGSDGKPEYDIDWDHDHGQGVPHGHNWDGTARGDGVPVSPYPHGRKP